MCVPYLVYDGNYGAQETVLTDSPPKITVRQRRSVINNSKKKYVSDKLHVFQKVHIDISVKEI
jgi:hypothetical protein